MEKYYFITGDCSKIGGPMFLEAGIYDEFVEKEKYIKNYAFPPYDLKSTPIWLRKMTTKSLINFPEKFYLINKHRKINFDIYYKEKGFIISDDFKKIIDSCNPPKYIASHLEVITREGVCNTNKEYWYIKILEESPCIDFEKSDLEYYPISDKELQPRISKFRKKIYFDSKQFINNDLFWIDNRALDGILFCNQESYEKIIKSKIKTIKMIEVEYLSDFLHSVIGHKVDFIIE